jgi:TolB protein
MTIRNRFAGLAAAALATLVAVGLLVSTMLVADMQPAKAAFPGQNGKIAFSSNRSGNYEIYTVSSTGTEVDLNQRTFDPAPDQQPAYSPDGSKIAFRSNRSGNWDIWTVNTTGTPNLTQITSNPALDEEPKWSPDGSRIAFRSNRSGNWDIWTIGSTGTEVSPVNITSDAAIDKEPAYSPDGSRIVFHSDFTGNMDIWTVNSTGSGGFDLITNNPAIDAEPAYSPDGNRIVFASLRSGNAEIYSVSSTGLEVGLNKITNNPALDEEPAYSPDGSKILFDSNRSGGITNYDIFTVSSTGTEVGLNKITNNPALDYSAAWQSLSDTTLPKVTSTVPPATATGVAPGANITATFSEEMDPKTLVTTPTDPANPNVGTSTTFKLFKAGTTTVIPAVVTYNATAKQAILNPNANLQLGTKYKAAVTTGAKDLAGNPLDQDQDPSNGLQQKGWSFTIRN